MGSLPLLGIHSHLPSTLASAKPDWLQLIFSESLCVLLALTPLLWGTRLCAGLLRGLCWLPLSIVFVSHNFGVSYSLPSQVHEPLEGTGCVFLWGAQHRTCDYECLLSECSNPIWLTQNVWKCDIKPPFTWKSEVVMKCVVLVSRRVPGVHFVVSPWWMTRRFILRMVYINLCLLPRKGPLTWGTESMSYLLILLINERDGTGREEGGGFRMGNTCIPVADSCWYMTKPIQYCKVKK